MAMDPLSVELVDLMNGCSLESTSDNDLQELRCGQQLEHIKNEGLTLLGDYSHREDECLQGLPPFLSSCRDNTAACHPGETIWDKFEFPNVATTEKTTTNLTGNKKKGEKDIKNDWDSEMWDEPEADVFLKEIYIKGDSEMCDEPKADVFLKEIYIKEDVMWCPKSSLLELLSVKQMEDNPEKKILAAQLVNTSNLLQPQSPSEPTMKSAENWSLLKENWEKCIVKMSSSNPQCNKVEVVPRANCFVPSPNALHAVTSNSTLFFKSSNTMLTSPSKTHLKNAILNIEKQPHFGTPSHISSVFTAKKNIVKAYCSNNMVAKYTKNGVKNRLTDTSVFSVTRKERTPSLSISKTSGDTAYQSVPSSMVEGSKRNGRVVRHIKQYSSAYTDDEHNFFVRRYIYTNNMTQKRKRLLNNKPWQQLRAAVPSTEDRKWASRGMILQEAVKYCKEIPHIIQEKQNEVRELQSQQKKLRETLSLLQLETAMERVRLTLCKIESNRLN